ncbi:LamG domain-containing protein [Mucilaginibacter sp. UR6-11]|uniref:LamG domain-containing protein n=1 Tax=Mucilaginibacter sp. UR6-11 TaxID=1435644 RepID=UPI001E4AC938|nr:LamG domain-containing protein [Mucilaginibacter sp. UR6-11]MCC8425273.1 LamG domain-containing protein [Mucilaginibacter sp. UR6-11]
MRNFTKSGLLSALAVSALLAPSCKKANQANLNSSLNQTTQQTQFIRGQKDQSLNSSLVAYWPMDGNGTDLSGNGHTATITGAVSATTDHFGNTGRALYFNNSPTTGSFMTVLDAADLRLYNTDYTINAWVNLDIYNASYGSQVLSKLDSSPSGWGCSITGNIYGYGPGRSYFGIGAHGLGNAVSHGTVSTGSWHMVSYVYHNSTYNMDMYIDGVLDTVRNTGVPTSYSTTNLTIGYAGASSSYYFTGAMDEIRVYSKALTASNISDLYTAPNPTGLLAYWSFDGNANDVSGNGNNGTAYNVTSTTDRNGVSGNAYAFNGTSSYVTVPDNVALRLNNTDYTLNAWVRVNSYGSSGMQMIAKRSSTATGYGWSLTTSGYDFFGPGGGTTSSTGTTFVSASATNWHMITVTYQYSTGTLTHYVDGVAAGSYSSGFPTPSATTTDPLVIGRDNIGPNYFFNGAIDDVRIYNKLLTTTEITALKNTLY